MKAERSEHLKRFGVWLALIGSFFLLFLGAHGCDEGAAWANPVVIAGILGMLVTVSLILTE